MSLNDVHAEVSRDVYEGDMDAVMPRMQIDIAPMLLRRSKSTGSAAVEERSALTDW